MDVLEKETKEEADELGDEGKDEYTLNIKTEEGEDDANVEEKAFMPTHGLLLVACNDRGHSVVEAHYSLQVANSSGNTEFPKIGSIPVGINIYLIP